MFNNELNHSEECAYDGKIVMIIVTRKYKILKAFKGIITNWDSVFINCCFFYWTKIKRGMNCLRHFKTL